jgi:quercetin dioxygenase-like cupin family protein
MKAHCKFRPLTIAAALLFCTPMANQAMAAQAAGQHSSHVAFHHALPPLNGAKLAVDVVQVAYGPGAASTPHSHPCPVVVYVLEGVVRTQVKGQPESVYKAGESFYEAPNGVHLVSANGSSTKPARFLAFFICDHDGPLSTPVQGETK